MKLRSLYPIAELTAEDSLENKALFTATRHSYSPRCSGYIVNDCQRVVLHVNEVAEFLKGVEHDIDINPTDKQAIKTLLIDFQNRKIAGEATFASRD